MVVPHSTSSEARVVTEMFSVIDCMYLYAFFKLVYNIQS